MKGNKFHYSSFFDKEKIFPFRPCIFQCVGKEFTLIIRQEIDILVVEIKFDRNLYMRILTVIEEKVVMNIFLVDSLPEKFIDFLQIGQCINIGNFILFWVIISLIVV